MVRNDANNDRVEQLKNSLKQFRKTVENSLQQITQTLTTLTTHENDERHNRGGPILSRGHRNDQSQKERIQPYGEAYDVEDDFEKEYEIRGGRFGHHRNVTNFEYRSISTWEDLTTHFLSQLFPLKRIVKLQNDIFILQQPQVQIFYDNINHILKRIVDYTAEGRLRKVSEKKAWATIEELDRYEDEGWNDPVFPEEDSHDYKNPNIEQLLGVMECKVDMLMKNAISLMGRSEDVCEMTSDMMRQLPPEPSRQEAFEDLVMNFILNQEDKVKQLEEYMSVIGSDFTQLSLAIIVKLKEKIRMEENRVKKIKKITRYPDTKDLEPLNGHKFSKALTGKASFHKPKFVSPKSLFVKYVLIIFPSPPFVRESTFGFKPRTSNSQNVKSRYDTKNSSPQSTPQVLPLFEEYTSPVTYPKEEEETLGTLI
nr:zinc finger, CCHC-type [Tanacetum cinerariifolium]